MPAESPIDLLERAYSALGFSRGELVKADVQPSGMSAEDWIEKADWLAIARKVGAETVLFVNNNPVVVFAHHDTSDPEHLRRFFNTIWCMARPALLFLATPGELAVYDLSEPPSRTPENWRTKKPLAVAHTVAEVAQRLHEYARDKIESGKVFEDDRFEKPIHRADRALIRDLSSIRECLVQAGLDTSYAHSLIGRSIFIRYLEDRKILTPSYFAQVAATHSGWSELLASPLRKPSVFADLSEPLYVKVLQNKDFAYALFRQLARDLNGDAFPSDSTESNIVTQQHLDLVRRLLCGEAERQYELFFWAYRFDIIPIELISSIYEEFYHTSGDGKYTNGTHYTPAVLVDFLLSRLLTPARLNENPRVVDPACGSGIFLVESFRRFVRYRIYKQGGRRLDFLELREILRNQIAGIEINQEAVRVAAFSLYLALLNYQETPDILVSMRRGEKLPHLIYDGTTPPDSTHFNVLLPANAFDPLEAKVDAETAFRFGSGCADLVAGNPPWGSPSKKDKTGVAALNKGLQWCKLRKLNVGDQERSQLFTWKALDLLREGGSAALLLSSGVLFKHHLRSREFRQQLLSVATIQQVVNFAHVRDVFFSGPDRARDSLAPFVAATIEKRRPQSDHTIRYASAKKTLHATRLQAVVLTRADVHLIRQADVLADDRLWKVYWWGNHRDHALINAVGLEERLGDVVNERGKRAVEPGQGFKEANKGVPAKWLRKYRVLPTDKLHRYGSIDPRCFDKVPGRVERLGVRRVYEGTRLLVRRGISQKGGDNGRIIARVASESFCFRNSIHGFRFSGLADWQWKALLGIVWSSLARYYLFLTSGSWGTWHDEVHEDDLLRLPIRFPHNANIRGRIIDIVDQLREYDEASLAFTSAGPIRPGRIHELEEALDEVVFDLYELSVAERDLIRDMCMVGLDLLYRHIKSSALLKCSLPSSMRGVYQDVLNDKSDLGTYLRVFLESWNPEIAPDNELAWRFVAHYDGPMVAVILSTDRARAEDQEEAVVGGWEEALRSLATDLLMPVDSRCLYVDGMVRTVGQAAIGIIKRNERRLWTRSAAREDAEATKLQIMNLRSAMKPS